MGFVLGIAILLAVGFLISKAQDAFWKGANRNVLARGVHAEGQQLTTERVTLRASTDPRTLQQAVVAGLGLPRAAESVVNVDAYIGEVVPGHVQLCAGTKLLRQSVAALTFEPAQDGCTVIYRVVSWKLNDGIVTAVPQMRYLRRRIQEEVLKVDPEAVVTVTADV